MREHEKEFLIECLGPAIVAILLGFFILFLAGCEEGEKIRAEIYSVDPSDGSIYRRLDNGTEEFLFCTDKSARDFKCMHRNDLEAVIIQATRRCQ